MAKTEKVSLNNFFLGRFTSGLKLKKSGKSVPE